jgi:anti-anti-sigma factor
VVVVVLDDEPQDALGWDGHLLLLHGAEPERQTFLVAWLRYGLVHDEKVVYGDIEGLIPPGVAKSLTQQGVDVLAALEDGQLSIESPHELARADRLREVIEHGLAEGYPAVRVFLDSCWADGALDDATTDLENTLRDSCRRYRFSALCRYPAGTVDAHVLESAIALHAGEIRTPQLNTSMERDRMVIAGQLDVSNDALLTHVLKVVSAGASGRLVVNLSSVQFMGVAAARALVEGTEEFRGAGGRVVLLAPTGDTEWFLRVLGLDEIDHFELSGAA